MIRTIVAGGALCAILLVSTGCSSRESGLTTSSSGSSVMTGPITDEVNLPMAEVAEAIHRIAKEAGLSVSTSWEGSGRSDSQEKPAPKPQGIDAGLHASSNTGSSAEVQVRTMPDGRVTVQWINPSYYDTYLRDLWRARFQTWLKGQGVSVKAKA